MIVGGKWGWMTRGGAEGGEKEGIKKGYGWERKSKDRKCKRKEDDERKSKSKRRDEKKGKGWNELKKKEERKIK